MIQSTINVAPTFDDKTHEAIYALSSKGHGALALAESQAAERHRARVYERDAQF